MKALVCTLLVATATLVGCQSGRSHRGECCAEQRFYPHGTMLPPGAQGPTGDVSPAGYREAQAAAGYAPVGSARYPAVPQHFAVAPQGPGQASAH